jgi:negative regulator of sigma E activity
MRVLRYLSEELKVSEEDKKRWYAHWIQQGLSAVEQMLRQSHSGTFCVWGRTDAGGLLSDPAVGKRVADGLRSERISALSGGI